MSQARISDPRLVRELRHEVLRFGDTVRGVLGSTVAALNRVRDRLRLEQLPHWKRELLKREEAYQEARRRYLEAEDDQRRTRNQGGPGRSSSEEEQREMNRARRRREEAEEKLEAIRRWMLAIEKEGEILAHRCLAHDLALRDQVAAAGVRLEKAAAALDGYHDAILPPTSGEAPRG